jgi:F0F1-type ATP synthase membrane subunit b/b'
MENKHLDEAERLLQETHRLVKETEEYAIEAERHARDAVNSYNALKKCEKLYKDGKSYEL